MIYRIRGYRRYLNDRARNRQEEVHVITRVSNEVSPLRKIRKDPESNLKVERKGYSELDTLEQVKSGVCRLVGLARLCYKGQQY